VLKTHESKDFGGGVIASLSIPWGFEKGDADLGGYHLVWPRDLVETGGGFLAAGAFDDARRVLRFLQVTQDADGHWCQNMWLDGSPYWDGIQMDEAALPVLLVDLALRNGAITPAERDLYWPMIRRAIGYIARNGPVSPQDRWEEDAGYSPFTLGAEIGALLVAADCADAKSLPDIATYLREIADNWNASLEDWMYVTGTSLALQCGVEGYYVRVAEPDEADAASPKDGFVPIKNRPPDETDQPSQTIVSPDALALVRFGLRAADDPRIVDTVKVIDAQLRCDLPQGPVWYRYSGDGYGEHADGAPFDGTGQGRPWPLLAGERAHYELAAGHIDKAESLLATLERCAGAGGLLPEQVWDGDDIPERELLRGGPSGSAMPLVWAHSEHIKLLRSLRDGKVFDMPPQGVERYVKGKTGSSIRSWRFNNKIRSIPSGKALRVELLAAAVVHWSSDAGTTFNDSKTRQNAFGIHVVDLPVADLPPGGTITFTFFWPDAGRWEDETFSLAVVARHIG
jgi:glucoamylase